MKKNIYEKVDFIIRPVLCIIYNLKFISCGDEDSILSRKD